MDIELAAQMRSTTGKGAARSLRRQQMVPAVVYGPKAEPLPISLAANRLEKLLREMGEESKLLRLNIEEGADRNVRQVLIREVQVHPVRRQFLHVDFYEVPLDHPIVVEVPVELLGEPVGVKEGGLLNLIRRTLSVRCLPGEIPEKVSVDISGLEIGSAVHVADLVNQVPFELTDEEQLTVVTMNAPEGLEEAAGAGEGEEVGESAEGGEVTAE